MPDKGMCRYGTIIKYEPMLLKGIIRDRETGEKLSFRTKHVFSPLLRHLLAKTCRFHDHANVIIEPEIEVSYVLCLEGKVETAGKVCLEQEIDPGADLAKPVTGVVTWYGGRGSGGNMSGWIQPDDDGSRSAAGPDDERKLACGFSTEYVIDPVLLSALEAGSREGQKSSEWRDANIRVRFWKAERGGDRKAFHIAWDDRDEASRQARDRRILKSGRPSAQAQQLWLQQRAEYLDPPASVTAEKYEEALRAQNMTPPQKVVFENFRKELIQITASEPAIMHRVDEFWQLMDDPEKLQSELNQADYIADTGFAKLCVAACAFAHGEYAKAFRGCLSAKRYNIAADAAELLGYYGIEQRFLEESMYCKWSQPLVKRMADAAQHTGNAEEFCGFFSECMEEAPYDPVMNEFLDEFCNQADFLLEKKGVDAQEMEEDELCSALETHYNGNLPDLEALLDRLAEKEAHQQTEMMRIYEDILRRETEILENPAAGAAAVQPDSAAHESAADLQEMFRTVFRDEEGKKCRVPDPVKDARWLPMLDQLLAAEADPKNCRIPMLVRLCLDHTRCEKQLQRYADQWKAELQANRKQPEKDRRFRMAQALLEAVQAADAAVRAEAMKKALNEKPTDEEKPLLEYISGRMENGK